MKQWTFEVEYKVKRSCFIEASTEEEAKLMFKDQDWMEEHDMDIQLLDAHEPDWDEPDSDDGTEDEG